MYTGHWLHLSVRILLADSCDIFLLIANHFGGPGSAVSFVYVYMCPYNILVVFWFVFKDKGHSS